MFLFFFLSWLWFVVLDIVPGIVLVLDIVPSIVLVLDIVPGIVLVLDIVPGIVLVLEIVPGIVLVLDIVPGIVLVLDTALVLDSVPYTRYCNIYDNTPHEPNFVVDFSQTRRGV